MDAKRTALWLGLLTCLVLALVSVDVGAAQAVTSNTSAWPMARGGPQRTGRSIFKGPKNNNTKWFMALHSPISSSPVIGPEGHVYFLTEDGYLFAVDGNGKEQWHRKITPYAPLNAPAVDTNGTVYVTTLEGVLHALFPNGTERWSLGVPWRVPIETSPTVFNDLIYLTTENGFLYCIGFKDKLRLEPVFLWNFRARYRIATPPAVSPSGVVYFASDDGYVYAVAPGGYMIWKFQTDQYMRSGPALGDDGIVYVGDNSGYIYALNPNGSLKWFFRTGAEVESSPAVDPKGNVYVGSSDGYLYAFNDGGYLRWKFKTGGSIISSPCLDSQGSICFGSSDGYLYGLLPNGELSWRYETGGPVRSSPTIDSDSTLYFGSDDCSFRAVLSRYTLKVELTGLPAGLRVDLRLNGNQAGQLELGRTLTFELLGEEPVHLEAVQGSIDTGSGSHHTCDNASVVVNPDVGAVVFRYRAEHLVTVESENGNATGAGWYDEGSLASIRVPATVYLSGVSRSRFVQWSGDSESSNSTVVLLVNGPKKLTANYVQEHMVNFKSRDVGSPNATLPVIMHVENDQGQRGIISNSSAWMKAGRYMIWVDNLISLNNQTQIKFVRWVGNVSSPGSGIQLDLTGPASLEVLWTKLYLVRFGFVDSEAQATINPSRVAIQDTDGQRIEIDRSTRQVWLSTGTWKFTQIIWSGVDVKRYPATFNVESPRVVTAVCSVHRVLLSVVDPAGLPGLGNMVTVTFANGTEFTRLVGTDGKLDLGQVPEVTISIRTSFLAFANEVDTYIEGSDLVVNAPLSVYTFALLFGVPSATIAAVLVWRRMSRRPPIRRKLAPIE